MYTVFATFPAKADTKDLVFAQLDDSAEMLKGIDGCLAYQVLQDPDDELTRAAVMIFESREAFLAMLKTDESKQAHAEVDLDNYATAPTVNGFEVIGDWHTTASTNDTMSAAHA